jgi:RluA family pseudouridine synthase
MESICLKVKTIKTVISGSWTAPKLYQANENLPDFLCSVSPTEFPTISSSKRCVRRGLIQVNGIMVKDISISIKADDVITRIIKVSALKAPIVPNAVALTVIWEDEYFAVVVKPQGMSVFTHKGSDVDDGHNVKSALVNSVGTAFHSIDLSQSGVSEEGQAISDLETRAADAIFKKPLRRPQPVHRLDKETGGLLLVAKTHPALRAMTRSFATHTVEKLYMAIVAGRLDGSGTITYPLDGKPAVTKYESLQVSPSKSYGEITTLKLSIQTGRTHQIRRHLQNLGHPVVGDRLYGSGLICKKPDDISPAPCMFLWSISIRVAHPFIVGDDISCNIEEPDIYQAFRRLEADFT